jgi:putative phosphoribosyl transferase
MYFENRPDAGRQLAAKLAKYEDDKCVVLALSQGGVIVGAQIAIRLHCRLMILLSENITLPGENEAMGAITDRTFSYSSKLSQSDKDEINGEFHGVIDQLKLVKRHELNSLITPETMVTPNDLRDKVVIAVTDGFDDTLCLDVLEDFIKPIRTKKLVIATPLTNVKALDKIHLLADELVVLNVREDIVSIDHHYENNIIPDHAGLTKIIRNTI